ncbi:MAG: hypothetical protein ACOC5E_00310, partial [Acidobacteriota bacterium]
MRKLPAVLLMLLAVLVFACAPAAEEAESGADVAADAPADEEGGEEAMEHDHEAETSDERAPWSKPWEVYEFTGVEEGDVVLDLLAGGGYNTLKVAEVVGPEGKVLAERARPAFQRQVEEGEIETAAPVE